MKMTRALAALVATGAASALLMGMATPAAAAPRWVKTSATRAKAHSTGGYKVTVAPTGFKLPKGYVKVANTVAVKIGNKYIAKNRKSVRLAAGTYTAYSTFKYRKKTAYTAHRNAATEASYCTVEGTITEEPWLAAPFDYGWHGYTGTCVDDDGETMVGRYSFYMESYDEGPGTSVYSPYSDTWSGERVQGRTREAYTAYRYGPTKTAYRYRTVTITNVYNPPTATYSEYKKVRDGDSLTRVRSIFGSCGTLESDDSYLGAQYRWRTSAGGYAEVWFGGYGDTGAWSWDK